MKKQKLGLFLSFVFLLTVILTSCSKKMSPLASSLFTANPSPLELVGTKVPVTINGKFPEKWFDKNATVEVIPVLKYTGGEAMGTSQKFQGEKVTGNSTVINQKTGGSFTLKSQFDYVPEMKKSELYLRFNISRKGKAVASIPDVKIADGVIATASLADAYDNTPSIAPDAFQRIIKDAYDADILFLIQQAELRSSELNSKNIDAWKKLVKDANDNERQNINVEIAAYASPDGGYELNDKLAEKREVNTRNYLDKEFKKEKVEAPINAKYTAQDWEGFKKLVEASSLQDKDLILRVISMYQDPETREREIKNISVVYSELAETILPKLRRSRLIANIETIGKTDEELKAAVKSNPSSLSVEELLYTANLDGVDEEAIYQFVTKNYPSDYRGWNNLGVYYFENNQPAKASENFNKASQLSPRSPETNLNLGLVSLANGNVSKAEQYFGNAGGADELNESLGLLYIEKGDYDKAVKSFGNTVSNNAALAQLLTKDYSRSQQTLDQVANKNATTYYLSAIVAARTNNASGVASNLKSAINKGLSKNEIANDIEFAKYLTNSEVLSLLK